MDVNSVEEGLVSYQSAHQGTEPNHNDQLCFTVTSEHAGNLEVEVRAGVGVQGVACYPVRISVCLTALQGEDAWTRACACIWRFFLTRVLSGASACVVWRLYQAPLVWR